MILLANGVVQPPPRGTRVSAQGLRVLLVADRRAMRAAGLAEALDRVAFELRARGGDVRQVTADDVGSVLGGRRARALVRAYDPTIVQVATAGAAGRAGRHAAHALGVPLVTSLAPAGVAAGGHGASGHGAQSAVARLRARIAQAYERWFHGAAQVVLCPTPGAAAALARRGVRGARAWSPGVDTRRFHPGARSAALRGRIGARPGDIVIAHVERHAARSPTLDLALDAFALARATVGPRLRLAIAAEAAADAAEPSARARTPDGAVHLGPLDADARAVLRASADLSLHLARGGAPAPGLLEAMAAGVAVVATDADATRAILEGPAGCAPRGAVVRADAAAMAARLAALADDAAAREMFVRRGLAYVADLDWDDVVDRLLESYAAALGDTARRPAAGALTVVPPSRAAAAPPPAPGVGRAR